MGEPAFVVLYMYSDKQDLIYFYQDDVSSLFLCHWFTQLLGSGKNEEEKVIGT